jgi:hypothetical protein
MANAIRDLFDGLTRGFSLFLFERDARDLGSVHRDKK